MKLNLKKLVNYPGSCLGSTWMMLFVLVFSSVAAFAQVSINTDGTPPDGSAMLEVKATNKGFLLPRMNLASRPASPVKGLTIFQLDGSPGIYFYDGAAWQRMSLASYDFWNPNGSHIYFSAGNVGIGTSDPANNGLSVEHYYSGKGAVRGADQYGVTIYSEGYLGVPFPADLGFPMNISNAGVLGVKPSSGFNGAAVAGWNNDQNTLNYGGLFYSDGANTVATNFGVYAFAAKANQNYAGFFKGRVSVEGHSGSLSGNDSTGNLLTATVRHTRNLDTYAICGISQPQPGFGYGIYGLGGYRGVMGLANGQGYTGTTIGVEGYASGTAGIRIGLYGNASGGTANWASYLIGSNYMSGDLRIGTTTAATGFALSINGKIACEEVLVQDLASWPDYVFKNDYNLMSLDNLEKSIKENGHLPGLPSAEEIEANGLKLGSMQKQLVEKVEELTLYTIEQAKMMKQMKEEMKRELDALKAENASLRKAIRK